MKGGRPVRWERLFDDLEGQLAAEEARDLVAEVADRTRRERALLGLHERLLAVLDGPPVYVRVAGVGVVRGSVTGVGPDWLLLAEGGKGAEGAEDAEGAAQGVERSALVPYPAVRSVSGLTGRLQARRPGAVGKAFALGAAMRAISRDRAVVELHDLDGVVVTGTIDAVGQDTVDLAEHASDLPRRLENVIGVRTVPFGAIALVRRR